MVQLEAGGKEVRIGCPLLTCSVEHCPRVSAVCMRPVCVRTWGFGIFDQCHPRLRAIYLHLPYKSRCLCQLGVLCCKRRNTSWGSKLVLASGMLPPKLHGPGHRRLRRTRSEQQAMAHVSFSRRFTYFTRLFQSIRPGMVARIRGKSERRQINACQPLFRLFYLPIQG